MPKEKSTGQGSASSEQQFAKLIAKFEPGRQKIFKAARKGLQKRFPTVNELVYDYGRSLVITYSPNERGSDGIVAISADAKEIRLVFTHGISLPDPQKILLGKATQIRYILLEPGKELLRPEVEAMMVAATKFSTTLIAPTGKGTLILKESRRKK